MSRYKQIRDAIFGPPLPSGSDLFMSKAVARDIESILPGQSLTITVKERQFVIVEREEFELIIRKAGYELKARVPGS